MIKKELTAEAIGQLARECWLSGMSPQECVDYCRPTQPARIVLMNAYMSISMSWSVVQHVTEGHRAAGRPS